MWVLLLVSEAYLHGLVMLNCHKDEGITVVEKIIKMRLLKCVLYINYQVAISLTQHFWLEN